MPVLPRPALMLVTDLARAPAGGDAGAWLVARVAAAAEGGVNVVQLREKRLDTPARIALGMLVREAIAGGALLLVNDDVEAARAIGADGVHLPARGSPRDIRPRLGREMVISCAVHSIEEAVRAADAGADLVVAGTVFPSASHPGGATLGIAGLRAICDAVRLPVIAVGGMTADTAGEAIAAGAAGVAAIGALLDAPDGAEAARRLRTALEAALRVGRCA